MRKQKRSSANRFASKKSQLIPTLLGTLVLLIVTGLLLNIFIYGLHTNQDQRALAAVTETITFTPRSGSDFTNEDGSSVNVYQQFPSSLWFGTGQSTTNSYLGIRMTSDKPIPAGAFVTSASLEFVAKTDTWLSLSSTFYAETSINPAPFTQTSKPSQRLKTSISKSVSDNVKWTTNTHYKYDITSVVQALPNSLDRSVISILAKGGSNQWGRKNISVGNTSDAYPRLSLTYRINTVDVTATPKPTTAPTTQIIPSPTSIVKVPTNTVAIQPTVPMTDMGSNSMAMMGWSYTGKNKPNPLYDKCDDGTDVVEAHSQYYVIAYDGIKYPTWHPPVVTNPITGVGKCYFGHEHGSNPQGYRYWDEIVQHFGKDINGDGVITKMTISDAGVISPGDRAGVPFGIANEHMNAYYNQEGRDSIFVRHEDHVGHKIEFVNSEADMVGHSTHVMTQLPGTIGVNIPYGDSNNYQPTGVVCTHFHKFHQGTHSGDAIENNMHEVIFHSTCMSVNVNGLNAASIYPGNTVLLTGMMTFGNPGGYKRFCGNDRSLLVCPEGKNSDGSCKVSDPLISKLPNSIYSDTLGRNMTDRSCLENIDSITGSFYFTPYEIWQGDLRITTPTGKMIAEHGRQWDVLDPIRFPDPKSSTGFSFNSQQCGPGGLLYRRTLLCEINGNYVNTPWDSPQSGFKGLKRTAYFGRNRVSNQGGSQVWWTDPLGGNAVTTAFTSGLKQKISTVEADICKLSVCSTMNDRAIQRLFNNGGNTVHAPN